MGFGWRNEKKIANVPTASRLNRLPNAYPSLTDREHAVRIVVVLLIARDTRARSVYGYVCRRDGRRSVFFFINTAILGD